MTYRARVSVVLALAAVFVAGATVLDPDECVPLPGTICEETQP